MAFEEDFEGDLLLAFFGFGEVDVAEFSATEGLADCEVFELPGTAGGGGGGVVVLFYRIEAEGGGLE